MRTNNEIDNSLMRDALAATGLTTKREVVEAGLRKLLRIHDQRKIMELRGQVVWEGDLDDMRTDKVR